MSLLPSTESQLSVKEGDKGVLLSRKQWETRLFIVGRDCNLLSNFIGRVVC